MATFTGLSINQLGTAYRLVAFTDPLTTTYTTPVTVYVAPTIVISKIIYAGKGRNRHIVGLEIQFSKPITSDAVQDVANYKVTQTFRFRGKSIAKAVRLMTAVYNASTHSVTLTISGKAAFARGGQIVINGSSRGGITNTLGSPLDGTGEGVFGVDATLVISPKGRKITLMS